MGIVEGKIAVNTASTRGIGLACAKRLAGEGAKVYLAARNQERAQGVIDQIREAGGKAEFVRFDAADQETYAGFVNDVVAREGRIDILVNYYGSTDVSRDHDILNTKFSDFSEILLDDLRSVWDSTQAVVAMPDKGGLSIVNIASTGGIYPDLSRESYGVAKSAIIRLTKDTAIQYAHRDVRANAVCPGCIATDAVKRNMSEEFTKAFLSTVPLGRLGEPEDIANAMLFYASDMSAYVTGGVMECSGGSGLGTPMYSLYQAMSRKG
jgi:NAD(P)-dependent dehydrogenase (short-subunit alcohol dehydrogenase family)